MKSSRAPGRASRCQWHSIEVLEGRIAPAVFYLSGADLHVRNSSGAIVDGSNYGTGAQLSILLGKGDSLVYDANGNHLQDMGEPVLMTVKSGSALVFATDFDQMGFFEANNITGIAVSNGFRGDINTDVNGSIVTALDATNHFTAASGTLAIQPSSIAGLSIHGQVQGNILAGGSISNLALIGGPQYNTSSDMRSVTGNIATGTAVNASDMHLAALPVTFDAGTTDLALAQFHQAAGTTGGSITNVRLDHWARNILTGDGGNNSAGPAGNGGKITNVTAAVDYLYPTWVISGNGGSSSSSTGGVGGTISGLTLVDTVAGKDTLQVTAGSGGSGAAGGGAGGSVLNGTIASTAGITGSFLVQAGMGGNASSGIGGTGGSLSGCVVRALGAGNTITTLTLEAGAGGYSASGGGGSGGGIGTSNVYVQAALGGSGVATALKISAGAGGAGTTTGGAGGSLMSDNVALANNIASTNAALLAAGAGGSLTGGTGKSLAGHGGGIASLNLWQTSGIAAGVAVQGGAGGGGGAGSGSGGAAGGVSMVSLLLDGSGNLLLAGGQGGAAGTAANGGGAAGGSLGGISISGTGGSNSNLTLQAGSGNSGSGSGAGGAGGIVNHVSITGGSYASARIAGGDAGSGATGGAGGGVSNAALQFDAITTGLLTVQGGAGGGSIRKSGGAGGALAGITLGNNGALAGGADFTGGAGGAAENIGTGGAGGAVARLAVQNSGGIGSVGLNVTGGGGGASAVKPAGGAGGAISKFSLNNLASLTGATIAGGVGGAGRVGGAGGAALGISISDTYTYADKTNLAAGLIQVAGGLGGAGNNSTGGGGGSGGAITTVSLAGLESNILLTGGIGGADTGTGSGGAGGTVAGVSGTAGIAIFQAGAGGASTKGLGGAGGSVDAVKLTALGQFVRQIVAGNGGDGAAGGGAGGSVSGIAVTGDIGDFASTFGFGTGAPAMGGIAAGIAGSGGGKAASGGIGSVTADRIAAMLAGTPAADAVSYANAARKIARITASVIGADINGDGVFNFTEGGSDGTYQPDNGHHATDGDTAIDGFVLVKAGGLGSLSVNPLKVIQV